MKQRTQPRAPRRAPRAVDDLAAIRGGGTGSTSPVDRQRPVASEDNGGGNGNPQLRI